MGIGKFVANWSLVHYGEQPLGCVNHFATGQGMQKGNVHLVASLGDEIGNQRGIDHKAFDPIFALE